MSESEEESLQESPGKKSVFREYFEAIAFALAIAMFLRFFIIEAFKIPSASMVPTLLVGDHIFVNKFIYGFRVPFTKNKILPLRDPERGEIIVFIYPNDESKDYIKRVVGVPGDQIEVKEDVIYVNGEPVQQNFLTNIEYSDINQGCRDSYFEQYTEQLGSYKHDLLRDKGRYPSNFGPITVGEDKLFVMGDNRHNSSDSRIWGQVPMNYVKGKALFIWMSIHRCGLQAESTGDFVKKLLTFQWLRWDRFFKGLH